MPHPDRGDIAMQLVAVVVCGAVLLAAASAGATDERARCPELQAAYETRQANKRVAARRNDRPAMEEAEAALQQLRAEMRKSNCAIPRG